MFTPPAKDEVLFKRVAELGGDRRQDVGKVEAAVKYVKNNFLPLRTFRDLADLNAQARRWVLEEAGMRRHGTTGEAPLVQAASRGLSACHACACHHDRRFRVRAGPLA